MNRRGSPRALLGPADERAQPAWRPVWPVLVGATRRVRIIGLRVAPALAVPFVDLYPPAGPFGRPHIDERRLAPRIGAPTRTTAGPYAKSARAYSWPTGSAHNRCVECSLTRAGQARFAHPPGEALASVAWSACRLAPPPAGLRTRRVHFGDQAPVPEPGRRHVRQWPSVLETRTSTWAASGRSVYLHVRT